MQILFVHPNFPAQFGPVARRLAQDGVECVFVSKGASGMRDGIRCIPFQAQGGALASTHYCSRTFENAIWNSHAVYEACRADAELAPDLIVGHSGFGTTLFLADLYQAPIVSLFEYYYRGRGSDMDYRPEYPPRPLDYLRARARNAMILLDGENATAAYTPTEWQRSVFPEHLRDRLEVIHDGIDTSLWCRTDQGPQGRSVQGETIPDGTSIVTYVARGLEAMRGFDVFVRTAKEILMERPETIFVVVGGERTHYGNDRHHIDAKSFCQHVLAEEQPDLNRFRFLGTLPPAELARVLSVSDLHIYLTVPFVLSWSLLNAMACACPVLASETGPVSEVVRDGYHGRLAPFADHIALGRVALELLEDRQQAAKLAEGGRALVEARYSLDATYPRLCDLFARAMGRAELLPGH